MYPISMYQRRVLRLAAVAACSLSLSSCAKAPEDPSWNEDMVPVIVANCVRCHGSPALGGAPTDFRLDRYGDTQLSDGRIIRGAATMAQFMAARAGIEGTMPPDFDRATHQRDTFVNWFESRINHGNMPRPGRREGNGAPVVRLLEAVPALDKEDVTLRLQIDDPNKDLVSGILRLGERTIDDDLQSGRREIVFNPSSFPPGQYELVAELSDDIETVARSLGQVQVTHSSGNTAPQVELLSTVRDRLFHGSDGDVQIDLAVSDPDAGDSLTLSAHALRGDEEVELVDDLAITTGNQQFSWDSALVPDGTGWRLRIEVSDGTDTSTLISARFSTSQSATDLGFSDVRDLLSASCASCHPRAGIPGLPFSLTDQDPPEGFHETVNDLRGLIYRRVVLEKNMPPESAKTVAEQNSDSWTPLTDAQREQLAEYLLGGSPQ